MAKRHCSETQGHQNQSNSKGCRAAVLIVIVCIPGLLGKPRIQNAAKTSQERYTLIFTQVPARFSPPSGSAIQTGSYSTPAGKSRISAFSPAGTLAVLTPEFISAANPAISFDGKRILFSGRKKATDKWNIWEMDIDGRNKKQITADFGNCTEPRHLALSAITPPDFIDKVRWITFVSDASNTRDDIGAPSATALYVRNLEPVEGKGLFTRRITFNISSVFSPCVLSDGRILFTSHQPSSEFSGVFPLMVTNWDGTGLNIFYSSTKGVGLNAMACETPDRSVIFVESADRTGGPGGQLAKISLKRPLNSHQNLTKSFGKYCYPRSLPDGLMLTSYKPENGSYGLYLFDSATGSIGRKIYDDPRWDELEGTAAVAATEPQGLLSAVVDAEEWGDLQCMNVYESDVPGAQAIKKGDIKRARFVEGVPCSATQKMPQRFGDAYSFPAVKTRVLGEVPVEADGSFFVRVPADTPFFIQTLDKEGMAFQTLKSWIWVRRGTSRGCIGCHENKELAPENRATLALINLNQPSLIIPVAERRHIDFQRDIWPIFEKRCINCHGASSPAGGLGLTGMIKGRFNEAYEQLLINPAGAVSRRQNAYVIPGSARTSLLIRILTMKIAAPHSGRHHPPSSITEIEMKSLIEWIDLGAPWEN